MSKLEKYLVIMVIVSSIGILLLEKTMIAMIVPIIAHYEWADDYQKYDTITNTNVGGDELLVGRLFLGDQIPVTPTVNFLYPRVEERNSPHNWTKIFSTPRESSPSIKPQGVTAPAAAMSSVNLKLSYNQSFGNHSSSIESSANMANAQGNGLDNLHPVYISNKLIALFMSYPLIALLLSPISGILGDRVGFDVPLLLALVAATLICLMYAFTESFLSILSARLLQGVASAFGRPNAFARMFVIYPQSTDKGKYVLALAMGANAFDFLGPAIVGFLFDHFGPIVCFLSILPYVAAIAICVSLTSFSSCRRKSDLERSPIVPINQRERSSPNSSEETSSGLTDTVERLWDIFTHSKIIIATLTISVVWLPRTSLEPTIAFWLE